MNASVVHRFSINGKRLACIGIRRIWVWALPSANSESTYCVIGRTSVIKTRYCYMTDRWLSSTASVSITRACCVYFFLKRSPTEPITRQAANQSINRGTTEIKTALIHTQNGTKFRILTNWEQFVISSLCKWANDDK